MGDDEPLTFTEVPATFTFNGSKKLTGTSSADSPQLLPASVLMLRFLKLEMLEMMLTPPLRRLPSDLLTKWNLLPDLKVHKFKPSQRLRSETLVEQVRSLITDPSVCATLGCPAVPSAEEGAEISVDELKCTVLNMNFFDALKHDNEIVTETDVVRGCMDETFEGITVQDKLREMLINPDSENGCVYSEAQKSELIYHLLKLVVVGGAMCQAEDNFSEWREAVKKLYKDMVTVSKNSNNAIVITSRAFIVDKWGDCGQIFKTKGVHNRYYVVADEKTGYVNVIYKPFVNFW
jgi:hypothetical protein